MVEAMETYGNPSSLHKDGTQARKIVEEAREKVASLINAAPDEIYFTSGATEANVWALSGERFPIVSEIEHHAVLNRPGRSPRMLECGENGLIRCPIDDIEDHTGAKPTICSTMAVNNETGVIQDVQAICEWAHSQNMWFHTDATQAVGHIPVDVNELGVDLLSMSAHKFGGPKGVGALFVRRGVDILPMLHGGHQEAGKRAGTENIIGIAGMGAAIEWATSSLDKSVPYLTKLRDQLIDGILDIPGAELTGHPTQRSPSIASFVFRGIDGQPLVLALDERGVCASSGSACSEGEAGISHVLKAMGYTEETGRGSLRLSIGWDTTEADVRYIIRAVKESVEELRK